MKRILVIEDEFLLRKGVAEILTYEGYKVIEAENGESGILAVLQDTPDLVLCDIMMPVVDGYEVLRRLQKNDRSKLIPFIFMTALAEKSDQRMGMELGSDDYITKPFTREELLNSVRTRLKKAEDIKERENFSLNELRTNIISYMPHELRTPLNGMLCYGEHLMDFPHSISHEELSNIGKSIHENAVRLHRLIQNYLTYTQLEFKKREYLLKTELNNLQEICETKAKDVACSHKRSDDLQLNVANGTAIIGNDEFVKIVEEFTDNAFKFSNAGTPVVVTCYMQEGDFNLIIEDQGIGIAASDIPKIGAYMQFDRKFYEQQGSGLGLVISKRIVELYSGSLSFESVPGKGTTVHVTLPGSPNNG